MSLDGVWGTTGMHMYYMHQSHTRAIKSTPLLRHKRKFGFAVFVQAQADAVHAKHCYEHAQGPVRGAAGSTVKLVCPASVREGSELHLDYGDKGSEELLFVYGACSNAPRTFEYILC